MYIKYAKYHDALISFGELCGHNTTLLSKKTDFGTIKLQDFTDLLNQRAKDFEKNFSALFKELNEKQQQMITESLQNANISAQKKKNEISKYVEITAPTASEIISVIENQNLFRDLNFYSSHSGPRQVKDDSRLFIAISSDSQFLTELDLQPNFEGLSTFLNKKVSSVAKQI